MNNIINIEDINLASALLAATAPIAKRAEIIITDRGERKVFYYGYPGDAGNDQEVEGS